MTAGKIAESADPGRRSRHSPLTVGHRLLLTSSAGRHALRAMPTGQPSPAQRTPPTAPAPSTNRLHQGGEEDPQEDLNRPIEPAGPVPTPVRSGG
jgi:hypothetical protein